MVVIQARMSVGAGNGRLSMSIVLDNGDIHHFFSLHDGVHHASTPRFRGDYGAAVESELARPGACVLDQSVDGFAFARLNDGDEGGHTRVG